MAARYEYDPYGQILRLSSVGGPGGIPGIGYENPFRFSTKRMDPTSDLVHYEYRVYSPGIGRWLNRDPLGEWGGANLSGMLGNKAINEFDILGLADAGGIRPFFPDTLPGEQVDISPAILFPPPLVLPPVPLPDLFPKPAPINFEPTAVLYNPGNPPEWLEPTNYEKVQFANDLLTLVQ